MISLEFHFDFLCVIEHKMNLFVNSLDITLHCKINCYSFKIKIMLLYYLCYACTPINDYFLSYTEWYGWSSTVNHNNVQFVYFTLYYFKSCSNSFHKTMTFVNVKTSVRIYVHAPSQVIILWFCLCIDFKVLFLYLNKFKKLMVYL